MKRELRDRSTYVNWPYHWIARLGSPGDCFSVEYLTIRVNYHVHKVAWIDRVEWMVNKESVRESQVRGLHGISNCMTELVLDCFHRDHLPLHCVNIWWRSLRQLSGQNWWLHVIYPGMGIRQLQLQECGIGAVTPSPVTFLIFKCQVISFRQLSDLEGSKRRVIQRAEEWATSVGCHKAAVQA
jgi:hypothetical protein